MPAAKKSSRAAAKQSTPYSSKSAKVERKKKPSKGRKVNDERLRDALDGDAGLETIRQLETSKPGTSVRCRPEGRSRRRAEVTKAGYNITEACDRIYSCTGEDAARHPVIALQIRTRTSLWEANPPSRHQAQTPLSCCYAYSLEKGIELVGCSLQILEISKSSSLRMQEFARKAHQFFSSYSAPSPSIMWKV